MNTRKTQKKLVLTELTSEKTGRFYFIVCYICYLLYCATRNYYPQALTEIVPSGLFTKDVAGIVSSAYMIGYGSGMFINGFLCEKVQPFFYISFSLGLSAGTSALMYAYSLVPSPSIIPFIVIWGIAGYVQSGVWPILIRLTSAIMPAKKSADACTHLYTSSIIGIIFAYPISQQVLRMSGWRTLFLVSAVIGLALCLFFMASTAKIKRQCVSYTTVCEENNVKSNNTQKQSDIALLPLLLTSGGMVIMFVVILSNLSYKGLSEWVPTMLVEQFSVSAQFSVIISTALPVCTVVGAYIGRFLYHKLFQSEIRTSAYCMLAAVIMFAVIAVVGFVSLGFVMAVIMVIAILASCTSTMCVGLVPLRFAKYSRAGTLAGFFNGAGYIGGSLSSLMIGILTENFGWTLTIIVLGAFMLIGTVLAFATIKRWHKFVRS